MENVTKKMVVGFVLLMAVFAGYMAWYNNHYAMEKIEAYEVEKPAATKKVLIASQGSDFKNKVTKGVVERLNEPDVFVKVIDVSGLTEIDEKEWSAIILIHTWEMWKPPVAIKDFIEKSGEREKLVVFTTSGDGEYHMDEVDAITGASSPDQIGVAIDEIMDRVDKLLEKEVDAAATFSFIRLH